ncbi:hypothetical protein R3P38DRAFT_3212861 [Favolaschia claudopus]|uniref:Uncharacterized protein n=1 Tax=Favolaschia claudopus TaxID=2862362 RepID=A0AAW0AE44_9AGAR
MAYYLNFKTSPPSPQSPQRRQALNVVKPSTSSRCSAPQSSSNSFGNKAQDLIPQTAPQAFKLSTFLLRNSQDKTLIKTLIKHATVRCLTATETSKACCHPRALVWYASSLTSSPSCRLHYMHVAPSSPAALSLSPPVSHPPHCRRYRM